MYVMHVNQKYTKGQNTQSSCVLDTLQLIIPKQHVRNWHLNLNCPFKTFHCVFSFFPHYLGEASDELTTDVLRPDQRGPCKEPHLFVWILQAGMRSWTSSGSVATFTSDRALAQAEELTSHMKEKTTVTTKSWEETKGVNKVSKWNQTVLSLVSESSIWRRFSYCKC